VTTPRLARERRSPARRRPSPLRVLVGLLALAVVFAAGVAVGEALHDNPQPDVTVTRSSTLRP
jgi:hypothetical protein